MRSDAPQYHGGNGNSCWGEIWVEAIEIWIIGPPVTVQRVHGSVSFLNHQVSKSPNALYTALKLTKQISDCKIDIINRKDWDK